MNILAIDTSGRQGSVALARGDAHSFEVLEFRPLAGGMYSAELVPRLSDVLGARKLANSDVDLFAVCSGPGSFTGLRVGLSAVKALAEVLRKPIVACTVLEAICASASQGVNTKRQVIAALDAQRGEVFCGEYEVDGTSATRISETLSNMNDFTVWLGARVPVPAVYTPDPMVAIKIRSSGTPVDMVARPAADSYARIGLTKFLSGQAVSTEELDADYIRRSDAEIFSAPKK